jgi:hypothetical protein
MSVKETLQARHEQERRKEEEERYREVRRKELAGRVPDLRRREQIIEAEIAALRRRAQHPAQFVPKDELTGQT